MQALLLPLSASDSVSCYGSVVDDLTVDGKLYGLTYRADSMLLYYNKDLFDQAGVPEDKLYLLGEEEIKDPYGTDLDEFRQCRDQIWRQLQVLFQRLCRFIRK